MTPLFIQSLTFEEPGEASRVGKRKHAAAKEFGNRCVFAVRGRLYGGEKTVRALNCTGSGNRVRIVGGRMESDWSAQRAVSQRSGFGHSRASNARAGLHQPSPTHGQLLRLCLGLAPWPIPQSPPLSMPGCSSLRDPRPQRPRAPRLSAHGIRPALLRARRRSNRSARRQHQSTLIQGSITSGPLRRC
jgi:hypothetical protein